MKKLLFAVLFFTLGAQAETYFVSGKGSTKLEAIKALLKDSKAQVTKCVDLSLSDKATLVPRKKVK